MIAKVIVDVAVKQTDRMFDYQIPVKWEGIVEPGMRVIVPFGPRKVQGFVMDVVQESSVKKLKPLVDVLDIAPVLTAELLKLGFWLKDETLCFAISAFQAMLPAAMKARYKKEITLAHQQTLDRLPEEVQKRFQYQERIPWEELEQTDSKLLRQFQQQIKAGALDVIYRVEEKGTKKTKRVIFPNVSNKELSSYIETLDNRALKQRQILSLFLESNQPIIVQDLLEMADTTRSTVKTLVNKGLLKEENVEIYRDPYENKTFAKTEPLSLTTKQETAISPILAAVEENRYETVLLHGVTGSGKTEIYLQSIQKVLNKGKEAIVLVPEISLTPQMVSRFKGRFGSQVAVLHSGLSKGEKYDEWRKIHRKQVKVVVGARSAIFAPFEKLGILIIDEEHESSYKQEENPRYHARDVAIYRGKYHNCPVVLGSATPTLESYARAQKNIYRLIELQSRINDQAMPEVNVIDMREELRSGNRSMFSNSLFEKLSDRLQKKQQSVLFLNRRGYSTFVICRDCGHVVECPHCDISLTYHKNNHQLKCHYCGYQEPMPRVCPSCESEYIRFFGTGTQKVEEELAKVLPEARVIRMDVDTTSRKGSHERLLSQFGEKKADILLGTQMIAKGLDFPDVTLVGVLASDAMLNLPDFRASERTFQLLTQVSGRAGRHELKGEVIIQSYNPEHYSIELASAHNYKDFYKREMHTRKQHGYPPYYFLTLINVSHPDLMKAVSVTEKITSYLKHKLKDHSIVLGPVASAIPRIKDRYRYQCMVKYRNEPNLTGYLREILQHFEKETSQGKLLLSIDRNPHMMM
ncbi:primosomal protein N' [Bacillus taeanensis]|uniref:Replication restart protein PriA n=1 Tax=Bacillus taeanensis TaxID=273032 RepID=A0A366XQW1_9BACI|nr:primosomal protein N' [Bacillus taeanensis]RBW67505.1 primosomal protein N' [Bacillus taeanensis]